MTVIQLPRAHWGWHLRRDGCTWRATGPGFINPVKSPAGFGSSPETAIADLARRRNCEVPPLEMFMNDTPMTWTTIDGDLVDESS